MKALLKEDIIISLNGETEIGQLPKDVGLERLRFDGENLIDLIDLTEFWVRATATGFELHCIEVPDSQLVQMTYADKKYLTGNGSSIRLKTAEEIETERIAKLTDLAKSKLSNRIGKHIDIELAQLAFICALIVYARQQPAALGTFFDSLIPEIKDLFPVDRWEQILKDFAKNLKQFINDYYNEIDSI